MISNTISESSIKEKELLVRSVNERTPGSFRTLYSLYAKPLIRFSTRHISCRCEAEDVIQDVFVELWKSNVKFDDLAQIRGYLYKAVKSRSLTALRRRRRFLFNLSFMENRQSEDQPANFFDFHKELLSVFDSSLGQLPTECKRIFSFLMRGFSSSSISEKINCAPSTVRAQKRRGISIIRRFCMKDRECREIIEC
jgi:RNA polymerase sigma-70 factor (ECF subfamily)